MPCHWTGQGTDSLAGSHVGQCPRRMEDGRWHAVAIRGFGILDLPLVSHVTVVESLSHSALSVFICEMDDNEDDNGLLGNMSNK